jgi:methionyl aminopeptidase
VRTADELAGMRRAGKVVAEMHDRIRAAIRPGVSTLDLDLIGREVLERRGATSNFLGYHGYPAVICASPNDMVVHGIPGKFKLSRGDVLSIDIGVVYDGWVADAARTFPVGEVSPVAEKLLRVTEESLFQAVEQCRPGKRLGDLGHAVQQHVEAAGFSIVRSLVGHGIGRDMHEEPQIANYGEAGTGPKLEEGMVLAIEPMVNVGNHPIRVADDNWSVYSRDGSLAAHFEHTVAVTAEGPRILTPWHLEEAARAA